MDSPLPNWLLGVIQFIEDNLKNPVAISEISELAGYSDRHFQRIFRELTGESLMEYVRGRRLTVAMMEVVENQKRIIDIAFDFQFQSQESFSRAFQARFIYPPRRFRNSNIHNPITSKAILNEEYLKLIGSGALSLEPKISTLGERMFIGPGKKLGINSFGTQEWWDQIFELMEVFNKRKHEIETGNLSEREPLDFYMLSFRNDASSSVAQNEIHVYIALEVKRKLQVPKGMNFIRTPRAKYAEFSFSGYPSSLAVRGDYILGTWIPQSKYWFGDAPGINKLRFTPDKKPKISATFSIPLRERKIRTVDPFWD